MKLLLTILAWWTLLAADATAATVTARVLVSQDDIDLVKTRTRQVRVKLAGRMYETIDARIVREVPAASDRVTNLALSSAGGGSAPLDPQDTKQQVFIDDGQGRYEIAESVLHVYLADRTLVIPIARVILIDDRLE